MNADRSRYSGLGVSADLDCQRVSPTRDVLITMEYSRLVRFE